MSDVLSISCLGENGNVIPTSNFLSGYQFVQTALSQLRKTSVVAMAKQISQISRYFRNSFAFLHQWCSSREYLRTEANINKKCTCLVKVSALTSIFKPLFVINHVLPESKRIFLERENCSGTGVLCAKQTCPDDK